MNIAIVNDVPMAVEAMRRLLLAAPRHRLLWVAHDGAEAVAMCARERPDLILMDMIMPVMDGVEATRRIMAATPCAILVVTATVDGNSAKVFEALGAGALDAVNTPVVEADERNRLSPLLAKIDMLGVLIGDARRDGPTPSAPVRWSTDDLNPDQLVGIGASAGGPAALAEVLHGLPADFPAAVVIIQHVDEQFAKGLAEWLGRHSPMPVSVARGGERPVRGTVLVAGSGDHLTFSGANTLTYTPHPADYLYRPSVDVFFRSIVKHWRGGAVGVLLTGMGRDGAQGLKALRDAGCHTIAQDRATSAVYGMPKAAAALEAAVEVLPLNQIAPALKQRFVHSPKGKTPKLL